MRRFFITYADQPFRPAGNRIVREAERTGQFDSARCYGPTDVSPELARTDVFHEKRGGGYWSWKPDVVAQTLARLDDGDVLVYADAGCELIGGSEWFRYWKILESHDLIAQKIFQRIERWSRQTLLDEFPETLLPRLRAPQFMATVLILKKTSFTVSLIDEWRRLMIDQPELYRDVTETERARERPAFQESRHDQSILTALIYKALDDAHLKPLIHTQWDHVEYLSPFGSQVIRAMRWKSDAPVPLSKRLRAIVLRVLRAVLVSPRFIH